MHDLGSQEKQVSILEEKKRHRLTNWLETANEDVPAESSRGEEVEGISTED